MVGPGMCAPPPPMVAPPMMAGAPPAPMVMMGPPPMMVGPPPMMPAAGGMRPPPMIVGPPPMMAPPPLPSPTELFEAFPLPSSVDPSEPAALQDLHDEILDTIVDVLLRDADKMILYIDELARRVSQRLDICKAPGGSHMLVLRRMVLRALCKANPIHFVVGDDSIGINTANLDTTTRKSPGRRNKKHMLVNMANADDTLPDGTLPDARNDDSRRSMLPATAVDSTLSRPLDSHAAGDDGSAGAGGGSSWAAIASSAPPPLNAAPGQTLAARQRTRKAAERLREVTGASVAECVDALELANGDVNEAAAALLTRPEAAATRDEQQRQSDEESTAREAALHAAEMREAAAREAAAREAAAQREADELERALAASRQQAASEEAAARAAAAREAEEREAAAREADARLAADLAKSLAAARSAEAARAEEDRRESEASAHAQAAAGGSAPAPTEDANTQQPVAAPAAESVSRPALPPSVLPSSSELAAIDAAIEQHLAARSAVGERGRGRGGRGRGRLGSGRGFGLTGSAIDERAGAAPPLAAASSAALRTEVAPSGDRLEDRECVVCADGVRSHCFIPCGHLALCDACAGSVEATRPYREAAAIVLPCPVCTKPATSCMRLYM